MPTREVTGIIRIRDRRVSLRGVCLLSRGRLTMNTVAGTTALHRSWAGLAVRMEEAVAAVVVCSGVGPEDGAASSDRGVCPVATSDSDRVEEGPLDDRMEAEVAPAVTGSISRITLSVHTTMWL